MKHPEQAAMKMTKLEVERTNNNCQLYVEGIDLDCPACGVLVMSGTHHECEIQKPPLRKKRRMARPEGR